MLCLARLALLLLVASQAAAPTETGVIVETTRKGGSAERAGLLPGDVLLSWSRRDRLEEAACGAFSSSFTVREVEIEESYRGVVELTLRRNDEVQVARMPPGRWGLEVRPQLVPDFLRIFQQGMAELEVDEKGSGLKLLDDLAESALDRGEYELATWLKYRIATKLRDSRRWEEASRRFAEATTFAAKTNSPTLPALMEEAVGDTFERYGKLEEAEKAYRRALSLRKPRIEESLTVAHLLNLIGLILKDRGDFGEAERYFRRSLEIRRAQAPGSLAVASSPTSAVGPSLSRILGVAAGLSV